MQIFITHADADNAHATKICDALKVETPYTYWIDDYDLKPPVADYREAFHDALKASGAGLLILSRNIKGRANITAEWNFMLGVNNPLYVAKIDDVPFAEIDPRLSIIQWIDFSKGWDEGIKALAAAIRGEAPSADAPIITRRRVTGNIDSRLTAIRMSGRDADLATVQNLLKKNVTTVIGIGGLGKSRLAAEVVTTSDDIDSVIWHVASDISRADEIVELLRDHFGLPAETERADVFAKLTDRVLIVIDNAESVEVGDRRTAYVRVIEDAHKAGARVLVTSREKWSEIPAAISREHKLGGISTEAAHQAALDMAAVFGIDATLLQPHLEAYVTAARQHPRLIEWGLLQVREERSTLREIIREMSALKSADSQDALFEMIGKTAQKMAERDGAEMIDALKKLAVFRGGFTYDAAQAILGLQDDEDQLLRVLKVLARWSFIRLNAQTERRTIDALVIEGVSTAFGEDSAAQASHYEFYKALAEAHNEKQTYFELDVERDNLEAAWDWAWAVNDAEKAFWLANACQFYQHNRGRYEQRLAWAQRAADALANHPNEALKAAAHNSLGLAYVDYPLGEPRQNLTRAIAAYQAALIYRTPDRAPMGYAMTQNNLGIAYKNLASLENKQENLNRAIDAYKEVLIYYTTDRAPMDYATTQNNLGNAYGDLAQLENPQENLTRAIEAYQAALIYHTPDRAPMDYAATQNNLGNVYGDLAQLENTGENLKRAIDAFQEALIYFTPDRDPMNYALTQNNLGIAYRTLAQLENPQQNLKYAIEAYQEALIYYTPNHVPMNYAMTQNNLGIVYKDLAKLENPQENLKRAIEAYQAALTYYTPDRTPMYYAMTQANLGVAYEELGNIPQTIACWREAETYFRRLGMIQQAHQLLAVIQKYG